MKILIVGLGSMGKRRIRLLQKLDEKHELLGVDSNIERCKQVEDLYHIKTESALDEAIASGGDCAFICTPPASHHLLIKRCLQNDFHVFTELNLIAANYEENIRLAEKKNRILFLSSTFLYRDEVAYIKADIRPSRERLNYSYHVGQYLPDWHPWEKYSDFFVGNKSTNGCREIFAIELPWLMDVFGDIINVNVLKSKNSELAIDYNDNYLLLIEHASGHKGMMAVDVISRKPVRNFEVFGENLYISWDGSPAGLYVFDYDKKENRNVKLYDVLDKMAGYSAQIIENAYYKEICNFFHVISKEEAPKYSFEKDIKTLAWIDKIESD